MSNLIQNTVINKTAIPLFRQFLNLSSVRHKLIAGNLANVATPAYKSKDIDFHGEFKKAINAKGHLAAVTTHPAHIPVGQSRHTSPEIIENESTDTNGINNVNVDDEVANLAQNQIYFSVGARLLAKQFEGLRTAIKSK